MSDVPLPSWVAKINKKSNKESISKIYFFLMKELHLSYADISEMPVPAITALIEELIEFNKEQEKQMKKSQRKR